MCGEYVCASMYACMHVPAHKRCLGCLCYMYIGPLDLYFWLICSDFLVCFLRDCHEQMSGYTMPNKDIVFIKKKQKPFIKRLFSSSSLFVIRVVSSAYLRLLIFLPEILIPACASSSPGFLMMYSAYKLNKLNIQPWHTPFPIWNQSVVPCPVHRFLKRQVRWSGIPNVFRIFYSLRWSIQSKALA